LLIAAALLGSTAMLSAADWLQFRGPGGSGAAPDKGTPLTWSNTENIAWKTALPGPGGSSPIVVGKRVFLTCYTGYGVNQSEPGDINNLKLHLLAFNRADGKLLWKRDIDPLLPEASFTGPYITLHGYASQTPVSDGQRVYAFFGKTGVFAFDLDGKQLWQSSVGTGKHGWGSGTSPILYKNLVIVNASIESGCLVALDKDSGKEVWRATGIKSAWNTPVLVTLPGGAVELAVSTHPKLMGFDPDTGKELWHAKSFDWYVCPSLITHDGVLYGLQHNICVAVKAGGRGDVTESHTLWKQNLGATVPSMVYHDGYLYWAWGDTAKCVKASDGTIVYRERLNGVGEPYASPIVADGKIYYVSRDEGTFVIAASPKFKQLARNELDPSTCNASLAVSDSQLLLRSNRFLYCIGKTKE
jgi:outer membrane protein assembly factor BamB